MTTGEIASLQAYTLGLLRPLAHDGALTDSDMAMLLWLYAGFDYAGDGDAGGNAGGAGLVLWRRRGRGTSKPRVVD